MRQAKRHIYLICILGALVLSLIFWFMDSIIEYYSFEHNLRLMLFEEPLSLLDSLILRVPQYALIDRLSFMGAAMLGGIGIAIYLRRWRETSDRYETYVNSVPIGVFIADKMGRYVEVNQAAVDLFGFTRRELLSKQVGELLAPQDREAAAAHFRRASTQGHAAGDYVFVHKDGHQMTVFVEAVLLDNGNVMANVTDTSALHAAREREQHIMQVLQSLRQVNQAIEHASEPNPLVDESVEALTALETYHAVWIALLDSSRRTTYVSYGGQGESDRFRTVEQQLLSGIFPRCARDAIAESGVVVDDTAIECPSCPMGTDYSGSAMCVRLSQGDRLMGVLSVCTSKEYAHDQEEQNLLLELADDIAAALRRIELASQSAVAETLREQYAHIVAASQDGLCLVNRDYTYAVVNEAYARIAGATPDAIMGNTVADALGREVFVRDIQPRIDRCFAGEPVLWERWMTLADMSERYYQVAYSPVYDADGEVSAVAVRLSDITDLRTAERQLVERSQQLDQIIDELPDAVVFSDSERRITRVNGAFCRFMGYSPQEVIGRPTEMLYANKEESGSYADERAEANHLMRGAIETEFLSKTGEVIQGEMTGVMLRDADDQSYGFLVLARDIRERKAAEEQRIAMEQQLRQAQKMEAVGQLAGGVAHDFNNLLQVIQGYVEFLVDALPEGSDEREFADEIRVSADRAAVLTRQLLAFSRRQVLSRVDLDLDVLIQNLLKMLGRLIGEHISVTYRPAKELLWVNADPGQIEQVLMNLCVNARDAMPDGGRIEIRTGRASLDLEFSRRQQWARPGEYATLSVTDTGVGMGEVVLGQLFEPFFTTKEVGKGTGLGLATIYGIIQQHEGLIEVQSKVGEGSTFRVYLPLIDQQAQESEIAQVPEPAVGGTESILLAEDDPVVRRLTRLLLRDAGYDVFDVQDGVDAMAVIDARGGDFDLIMLDVVMPRASGRQVYERYRRDYPDGKVIFMSGYSTGVLGGDLAAGYGASFLPKPFSADSLLRAVREALSGNTG